MRMKSHNDESLKRHRYTSRTRFCSGGARCL